MSLPLSGVSRVLSSHAAANSIASAAAVARAATAATSGAQAAAMPAVHHGHFAQALNAAGSPVATPAPISPAGLP